MIRHCPLIYLSRDTKYIRRETERYCPNNRYDIHVTKTVKLYDELYVSKIQLSLIARHES